MMWNEIIFHIILTFSHQGRRKILIIEKNLTKGVILSHLLFYFFSTLPPRALSSSLFEGVRITSTKSVIARRPTDFWLDDVAISPGLSLLFFYIVNPLVGMINQAPTKI